MELGPWDLHKGHYKNAFDSSNYKYKPGKIVWVYELSLQLVYLLLKRTEFIKRSKQKRTLIQQTTLLLHLHLAT